MKLCIALGTLLLVPGLSTRARADCMASPDYNSHVTANTVTVRPDRDIGNGEALLRQDVASGTVVALAAHAAAACPEGSGSCFLDECVPTGTYRYGLANPFSCGRCWDQVPLFTVVTVTDALPGGCLRSTGNAAPTAYAKALPWANARGDGGAPSPWVLCSSGGCSINCLGAIAGLDLLVMLGGAALLYARSRRGRKLR